LYSSLIVPISPKSIAMLFGDMGTIKEEYKD